MAALRPARIAVSGFAPNGTVPAGTVAGYGCGVFLTLLAGRLAPSRPDRGKLSVGSSIGRGRRDRLAGLRSRF